MEANTIENSVVSVPYFRRVVYAAAYHPNRPTFPLHRALYRVLGRHIFHVKPLLALISEIFIQSIAYFWQG
jgi:hypothetical protein